MNPAPRPISDDSTVTVALLRWVVGGVITGCGALLGAVLWASSVNGKLADAVEAGKTAVTAQAQQGRDIAAIRESLSSLNSVVKEVKDNQGDQWTLAASYWWHAEFQRLNPTSGLRLPDLSTMPPAMRGVRDDH